MFPELLRMSSDGPSIADDLSLKTRFRAWWNGAQEPARDQRSIKEDSPADDAAVATEPEWNSERIAAIEAIWGNGYLVPGGERFARKLLAVLAFSSKKSVLDLTANIGGTARTLANQYNLWMDAFEPTAQLAVAGHRRSLAAGLGKRVPIVAIDFATFNLASRRYDAIYSREHLHATPHKERILDQCVIGLKDRGQIVLTDLILPEPPPPPAADAALKAAGKTDHLWTFSQYRRALERRGFLVYLAQDMTDEYLEQIYTAWSKAPERVKELGLGRREIDLIIEEGEMWVDRWHALKSGEILFGRIHAQLTKSD